LSDFEIEGIFNYLEMLVELNVKNGSKDKLENSADYSAYGSLWAQMMNKINVEITRVVTITMPTRFWGAYNDRNGLNCMTYMSTSGLNTAD